MVAAIPCLTTGAARINKIKVPCSTFNYFDAQNKNEFSPNTRQFCLLLITPKLEVRGVCICIYIKIPHLCRADKRALLANQLPRGLDKICRAPWQRVSVCVCVCVCAGEEEILYVVVGALSCNPAALQWCGGVAMLRSRWAKTPPTGATSLNRPSLVHTHARSRPHRHEATSGRQTQRDSLRLKTRVQCNNFA